MVDSAVSATTLHHKAHELLDLIEALNHSGSRLEDEFWESQLNKTVQSLLVDPDSTLLEQLLDYLVLSSQADLYDILVSLIEGLAESVKLKHKQKHYDVLLVTAPITMWTRYQLPLGELSHQQHEDVLALFKEIAAKDAKVAVLGQLLSFDQLPKSFAQTHQLCTELGQMALAAKPASIELDQPDESLNLLADTKFIVSAIVVPAGQPVFAWQEHKTPILALRALEQEWPLRIHPLLTSLFTGCQCTYLPPDGFFYNNRASDKIMRPLAVKAAVQWLAMVAQTKPSQITATIARCGEYETEEYRIGLSIENNPDLLYGCIWPIFNKDEVDISSPNYQDSAQQLQLLLTDQGIESIRFLAGLFSPEVCDDCEAPSFPNPEGLLEHPHLPEDLADYMPDALH